MACKQNHAVHITANGNADLTDEQGCPTQIWYIEKSDVSMRWGILKSLTALVVNNAQFEKPTRQRYNLGRNYVGHCYNSCKKEL